MESADFGRRLVPTLVDAIAASDPERVFISIPTGSSARDGFENVSFLALANAVNATSGWIEQKLGGSLTGATLAYIGPQDARLLILALASIKAGYKLRLPSPRLSIEAHISLLNTLRCDVFLIPEGPAAVLDIIEQIKLKKPLRTFRVDSLSNILYTNNVVPHYAYTKSFEEAKDDPFANLHTSGSTGMPKAVTINQRTMTALDATQEIRPMGGNPTHVQYYRGLRSFMPFPLFHSAGLMMIVLGIYAEMTTIFPPPGPLTAEMADNMQHEVNPQITILPPAILAEIAAEPAYLDRLEKITYVCYGGGPIPQRAGNEIASRSHLHTGFGSTEAGWFPLELPDPEDWQYLKFSPFLGHEMSHYAGELYELSIKRDPNLEDFQCIFSTFPNTSLYRTKDLFSKHPTKPGLWISRGRADDMIVYSTGEKLDPNSFEAAINNYPDIRSTLVCDQGHFSSALLIEAKNSPTTPDEATKLADKLWPLIQQANTAIPAYARVMREMILFVSPYKALPRAAKGTVQRRLAYDLYGDELQSLYEGHGLLSRTDRLASVGPWKYDAFESKILDIARSLTQMDNFNSKTSFFEVGFDSLQILTLTRRIKAIAPDFGIPPESIYSRIIYASPTVKALASGLLSERKDLTDLADHMQSLFKAYASEFSVTARLPRSPPNVLHKVLLTGSTGSLSSYLLAKLFDNESVKSIHCLNRSEDGEQRHKESMSSRELSRNLALKDIQFFQADFSKPCLGLHKNEYLMLLQETTLNIHNAWTVNFNQSLEQLASDHIRGVKQLADFSTHSAYGAFLFFISSIGAVINWRPQADNRDTIPEEIFNNWDVVEATGYSQAKLVAERVTAAASTDTGISAAICRIGQIAGPTSKSGQWPKQEWLTSLIESSTVTGKLPGSLGPYNTIDWVPVDVVADAVIELASASINSKQLAVYHIVNPSKTNWQNLLPVVSGRLGQDVVTTHEWLSLLRESEKKGSDVTRNPALKLLDFFEDTFSKSEGRVSLPLSVEKTIELSPALKSLRAIDNKLMELWLEQWHLEAYLAEHL